MLRFLGVAVLGFVVLGFGEGVGVREGGRWMGVVGSASGLECFVEDVN